MTAAGPAAAGPAGTGPPDRSLRDTLASYATGVAVVTTIGPDGRPVGLTVNSFTSVSLDPPLVLWCLRHDSASRPAFTAAEYHAVNVLAAGQHDLARRFAATHRNRFAGVPWRPGPEGLPILAGSIARLTCRTEQRHVAGDHLVLIGRVLTHDANPGPPLIFHGSRFLAPGLSPAVPTQPDFG